MATRRPLVIVDAQVRELPAGDALPASIAPGTIQYFATDPGAGWLKCDGSIYLRSSYADLSAALPPNLVTCPHAYTNDHYTLTGTNWKACRLPDSNLIAFISTGKLEILGWDPATQTLSAVASTGSSGWTRGEDIQAFKDGDDYYIAWSNTAVGLAGHKYSGGSFTAFTYDVRPTGRAITVCWLNGGSHLFVGTDNASGGNEKEAWLYSRSGTSFTKISAITSLPGNPLLARLSPSGKTLAFSMSGTSKLHFYDVSGTTLTRLGADVSPLDAVQSFAFHPGVGLDVLYLSGSQLRCIVRSGNTWTWDVQQRYDQYGTFPVGQNGAIDISPSGLLTVHGSNNPYIAIYTADTGGRITPVLFNDSAAGASYAPEDTRPCMTADSRGYIYVGTSSNKVSLIKCDLTKLKLPTAMSNGLQGWIKT